MSHQLDLFMRRTATSDDRCRYTVGRYWDDRLPIAAWLLTNPSVMGDEHEDQTGRRMIHFSRAAGCGGFNGANVNPLRTPKPAELWKMLARGELTEQHRATNAIAIRTIAARSDMLFVGFGPEIARRWPEHVREALHIFSAGFTRPLLCLGTTADGWPLHPLARGRFAIPNDRQPRPWAPPFEMGII